MSEKIGIVQVDGKYPNLALMQIAGYHEAIGDHVEWYEGNLFSDQYDRIYASKIFDFSPTPDLPSRAMIGGTGIDITNKLPPEMYFAKPSYSLYPKCSYHIGFSMKGCRFCCDFCNVPKKEGRPFHNEFVNSLLTNPIGQDKLMLLDNDFFGGPHWRHNIETIIDLNLRVCFLQGVNIRIITDEQAAMLRLCKYRNKDFSQTYTFFAWDRFFDKKKVFAGIETCIKAGFPPSHMHFYVLIGHKSTPDQDLERVRELDTIGCIPFVMPKNKNDKYQKAFARWVNNRAVFKSCTWEEYEYNPNQKTA